MIADMLVIAALKTPEQELADAIAHQIGSMVGML